MNSYIIYFIIKIISAKEPLAETLSVVRTNSLLQI